MNTSTPDNGSGTRSRDARWFAVEWLRDGADAAVRTIPVIAVVEELLTVLRDDPSFNVKRSWRVVSPVGGSNIRSPC
jgi:hypothetical protein